jgi:hypothetical protein
MLSAQVLNMLRAQMIFPPKPNFRNLFEFSATKFTQNQYLPHLRFENCEINSVKSHSLKAFQQHEECPQILIQFSVQF